MTWSLYSLKHPTSGAIRYVGKSCEPSARVSSHMSKSAALEVRSWVLDLRELGLEPEVSVLGEFADEEQALAAERSWISTLISSGVKLLNTKPGGESSTPRGHNPFSGLGHRVRQRRRELGITQLALAERSGVAGPTISRIECGKRDDLAAFTAVMLARGLGCSTEWLITGEELGERLS